MPFPLTLPFSQTYPLCCMDIRNLTDQYYQFSDGFSQSHRDVDDILKKSLDELLIHQVSNSIRTSLQNTNNLSQIAQIVVNAEHFRLACSQLEQLLAALRAPHRGGKLRLDASSHFNATLDIAQNRIDSAIAAKLREFFGTAEYDWTPTSPQKEPSEFLFGMLQWLDTMMDSVLGALPQDIKLEHYRTAFRNIGNILFNEYMLDKDSAQLSLLALNNTSVDVQFLKQQADEHEPGISSVFDELNQVLTLVISDKVNEFAMNTSIRQTRYKSVNPAKVATILEKLGRYESRTGTGDAGERAFHKRRAEREAVLRLIRR